MGAGGEICRRPNTRLRRSGKIKENKQPPTLCPVAPPDPDEVGCQQKDEEAEKDRGGANRAGEVEPSHQQANSGRYLDRPPQTGARGFDGISRKERGLGLPHGILISDRLMLR